MALLLLRSTRSAFYPLSSPATSTSCHCFIQATYACRSRKFSFGTQSSATKHAANSQRTSIRQSPITSALSRRSKSTWQVGTEPGTDSQGLGTSLSERNRRPVISDIRVIDFSDRQIQQQSFLSETLPDFLSTAKKPDWAACRWIYVNGIDPHVVKTIGHAKKLHRLAIEDVLDTTGPAKVDWYEDHCFMELPLQKLVHRKLPTDRKEARKEALELKLRQEPRGHILSRTLAISVEQASIFLTADNTVVTFFETSGNDVLKPILARLEAPETLVRSSNDPWMLAQAVIDAVVDLSLPIGNAVDDVFSSLESAVLTSPAIAQSRAVYVLRSGLTLLISNTNAVSGLVRTLIDHRAVTLPHASNSLAISAMAQVYLQDVQDHLNTLSSNTYMSIRSAENLNTLIFNMIAASQNESVRQLTLISSFFLPLTFLTGYFGMNFDPFPAVNNHSDDFFWIIATPIMLTSLALLLWRSTWIRALAWRRRRQQLKQSSH